ncbi:MAG: dihydroxyacetone kinase subunit DhaL [Desulfobacterales bacterium]|jgi:dihydroxyacetone kinase-like protein
MKKQSLTLDETRAMFANVAREMVSKQDLLTQADKAIGDGDHGIGMTRGFEAVLQKLSQGHFDSVGAMLQNIGTTLLMSIGGAAGAIFGTWFRSAATPLMDKMIFDSEALASMLTDGLSAVKNRGKAKPGDKTMVDALEPAACSATAMKEHSLEEALFAATKAAQDGMENTKNMVATMGKAKTLGKRAIGHPDPGALSTYLILSLMTEYLLSGNS